MTACPDCGHTPCLGQQSAIPGGERCVLEHRREPCRPRRALPGLYVCAGHRARLGRDLAELPGMHERLAERHAAGSAGGPKVSGAGHGGLSLHDDVSRLRGDIYTGLAGWARIVAAERRFTLPADTVPAIAAFLLGSKGAGLDWLAAHSAVDEFADTVEHLHREAFRLLHPTGRRRIPVAVCAAPLWSDVATRRTWHCAGRLVVTLRETGERMTDAECDECGRTVAPRQWQKQVDREAWLTAVELAGLWAVGLRTVQRWAVDDGWLSDAGRPARYSVRDAERTLDRLRPEGATA